jgi:hypothetical protein
MENTQIKSKRASEMVSTYDGFYCLSTYVIEFNNRVDEITINTKTMICKSHFVKWTNTEMEIISKNIIPKFKRFITQEKKLWKSF